MKDQEKPIGELLEKSEHYIHSTLELYKLKFIDKSSDVISTFISQLVVICLVAIFLLVLNIGLAIWLGDLMGKNYYGFFTVAGFYGLVSLLIYIFRYRWIKVPIENAIIVQSLK